MKIKEETNNQSPKKLTEEQLQQVTGGKEGLNGSKTTGTTELSAFYEDTTK